MARPINTKLTKQMLQDMGIVDIHWDKERDDWYILRHWFKNKSKTIKTYTRITITQATRKHKYAQSKAYPKINFYYKNKGRCYPLARVLYAWFKGDIDDGMVVDHIDNNPFNNCLSNLQLLTQERNLEKRYKDNPKGNRNQWDAMKKEAFRQDLLSKYYIAQGELVNVVNSMDNLDLEKREMALSALDEITDYLKKNIIK